MVSHSFLSLIVDIVFKSHNGQHTNNIHSFLLSNYNIIVFIGNKVS